MDAVRKIMDNTTGTLTIVLPEEYHNKKVEVIVLPLEESNNIKTKYNLSRFFGKLQWQGDALAEQKKLRDEWD